VGEISTVEPSLGGVPLSEPAPTRSNKGIVGDFLPATLWTTVSRFSGLVRAAMIAAVLGATYLGNTFQAINSLPNLVYYQLLAGSLFVSVLVPMLVRHLDRGDTERAGSLVSGFVGVVLIISVVAALLLLVGGRLLLFVMASGVSSPAVAHAQTSVGARFLLFFVPQVPLYMIAGIGAAVMNANRRYALAAAGPAIENVGIIVVMIAVAALYATQSSITGVPRGEVLLLGVGTTAAVACHALSNWWGARRTGMIVRVRVGWHDPEVRVVLRRMLSALAYSAMAAAQLIAVLIAANRVAGGVVAFQLALNFYYLPLAVITWPIARALLPRLARGYHDHDWAQFRWEFRHGIATAWFVVIPVAISYLVLSVPLARAISFGKLRTTTGIQLLALAVAALAVGIIAETWFILATYVSYACEDMRTPLRSMALRAGVSIALIAASGSIRGPYALPTIGLAMSIGSTVGALHLSHRVGVTTRRRVLGPNPEQAGEGLLSSSRDDPFIGPLVRTIAVSIVMVIPAWLCAGVVHRHWAGHLGDIVAFAVAGAVGAGIFVAINLLLQTPELTHIRTSLKPEPEVLVSTEEPVRDG
jgi:putative peptidoglycan lipid II flippase